MMILYHIILDSELSDDFIDCTMMCDLFFECVCVHDK